MVKPALTFPHCGRRQSGRNGLKQHIQAMHPRPVAAPAEVAK